MLKLNLLVSTLLLATSLFAQTTPSEAVIAMGRGINLGNTLEPPTEGGWNNPNAEAAYFDAYVEAGFTNVRVPVRWDQHTSNSAPYTISAAWMDRVEEVVDWGLSRGLWITLNGHHEDWLKNDYSPSNKARYDAIWRQIVARFQGKSDHLLYEIINEPNGLTVAQVDDLNARILGIIRAEEPTRIVIFSGNMYSNAEQLVAAAIPPNDDYLIGYYHSYDPWSFAGQSQGTWGTSTDYRQMANKFQLAQNWSDQNNIPVHVSEFGVMTNADFNSRMRWYAEYVELCLFHGFTFSVWDDGGDFKVMERAARQWPEVKDILIHYHEDSPDQVFTEFAEATPNSASGVLLKWNNRTADNGDITIERRSGSGPWNVIGVVGPATVSYLDTTVVGNRTYDYRMYTTRTDGTLLHGYPSRVRTPGSGNEVQAAWNNQPQTIPGILEVEDYDTGGQSVAYNDTDPANQGGGYRLDEGVDIGGGPGGGFVLGYVSSGEWIEYTVDVVTSGIYAVTAEVASADAAATFRISSGGEVLTTFNTPLTGGWNNYQTVAGNSSFYLEAGQQLIRLEITGSRAFNTDRLTFRMESTAVEEEASAAGFTASPNPVRSRLHVRIPAAMANGQAVLQLFNAAGAKLMEQTVNSETTELTLSAVPAGTYLLRLNHAGRTLTRRIVVE